MPTVVFHYTEDTLSLYRTIHSEQCSVYAFKIV
nr:MAG TPA: hypothetical protein [Caudoviricetes sp.]